MWDSKIHSRALKIKSILGALEKPFWKIRGGLNKDDLLVLNYHSTPKKFIPNLEKQLLFFQKEFDIISPNEVSDFYKSSGNSTSKKIKLLLTFDDGLANNLLAIELLNKYSIKAIFFVVPKFIDSDNQKEYYLKNIRPEINDNIDFRKEDFEAMSWGELSLTSTQGHKIESHSLTHVMCAEDENEVRQNEEIVISRAIIENKLNIQIDSFCAPNDSLKSVNSDSLLLIKQNYTYFYSTFPGSNSLDKDPMFIKRSNVECFWPLGAVKFALGNFERKRWKEQRVRFSNMLDKIDGKN
jgi:peptidoglycan/xylan/chitin deacetylase (PgdA/CDA1 family)